jgi:integrase
MARRISPARSTIDRSPEDPCHWTWPVSPVTFRVYDKYADADSVLSVLDSEWKVLIRGRVQTFVFSESVTDRVLQQKLVMLTQVGTSAASIVKFSASLIRNWNLYKGLLSSGPLEIKRAWKTKVNDAEMAKTAKQILKLASLASAGPWLPTHADVIAGLSTKAKGGLLVQKGKIRRREKLLSIDQQAAITRVLDEGGQRSEYTEAEAEGFTALAMLFQLGMRPIQVISLNVDNVSLMKDAADENTALISFHAAKRRDGWGIELLRQLRPEWISQLVALHGYALKAGRRRLFLSTKPDILWTNIKAVMRQAGEECRFKAGNLRHTGAQTLADGGSDLAGIQKYLGHAKEGPAHTYLKASRQQGEFVNRALGVSKLYGNVLALASRVFVTVEEMLSAGEDQQIGGVVGDRLVAGIGLCRSGQSICPFNPVTSCYGCGKFMPSLDRGAHLEAVHGMRAQVRIYLKADPTGQTQTSRQLTRALAGAQQALDEVNARNVIGSMSSE